MAYDEGLAERIREVTTGLEVTEKRMFGGIAWMWRGNMLVGIVGSDLMARIGAAQETVALKMPGARPMDFTGRPMKGYVFVRADAVAEDGTLAEWVEMARRHVATLPPK